MNEINNNKQAVDNNNQHKKHKRNYDKDFIQQVIGVYKSGAYETIIDCANAYGICSKTLGYWLRRHNQSQTPEALSAQATEIANLKKELARAKMENEILKKASIYFANLAR